MTSFAHVSPKTVSSAASYLAKGNAMAIGGGTDVVGTLKAKILPHPPATIVDLKTIPDLDYIKEEGGMLKIGALTRLEDVAKSSMVEGKWQALAEAAHRTASPHIREMGTIGGNICQDCRCWYYRKEENRFDCLRKNPSGLCYGQLGENRYHSIFGGTSGCFAVNPSDTAPALVALNATVVTNKRNIPIEEFFTITIAPKTLRMTVLDDDEIVTEIQVPEPASGTKSAFLKFAIRKSIDFPIVNCAAAIVSSGGTVSSARICLNAVKGTPRRATEAEEAIKGKAIDEDTADAAGAAAVKGAMALPYNKYKIQIARTLVKRAILACA